MSLHNFLLLHLRSQLKNSCFVLFIRGSKHLEAIKALRLRRRAFNFFSVFGTPDEKLALVFDLLLLQHSFFFSILEKKYQRFLFGLRELELVAMDPSKVLVQLLVLVLLDVVGCCIFPPNAAFKKMFSPKYSMVESSVQET